MNPNREELLFRLALTKPAAERAAWLDRECGDDKALRARLQALLAAHEQPATELDSVRRDELHESPAKGQGLPELGPPDRTPPRLTIKLNLAEAPDEASR